MLALVAGEGALPGILMHHLDEGAVPFRLCELDGHPCEARGARESLEFRIETLGSFIASLKSMGVTHVCFVGRVARPKLDPSAIDSATMPLVPRMMAALQAGDDGALRVVLSFFEEAGIAIKPAHEIMPDLLPSVGVFGAVEPSKQDKGDVARGAAIINAMAQADVGQACIVAGAQALAIEAIGGTDWMMRSVMADQSRVDDALIWDVGGAPIAARARDANLPAGGVLVKASKPGQDLRVDMATIGPATFMRAAQIGLRGVAIEAGCVMVLDLNACTEIAKAHGLFFHVYAPISTHGGGA